MSANKSQIGGGKYKQGKYKLINTEKYKGDPSNIVYRSSWEQVFCQYLDNHKDIIKWACEDPVITYTDLRGKIHRYYPDFMYIMKIDDEIGEKRVIVEIKPHKDLSPPDRPKKETTKSLSNYEYSIRQHIMNKLKWAAAEDYCRKRGMQFIILTEKHLKKAGLLR